MGRTNRPRKITDYETVFWFAGGTGVLREELWVDEEGRAVRYNLAFIAPHLSRIDNGRILGYDNAHGVHERHWMGRAEAAAYHGFPATARRFYREVDEMRRNHEG